MRAQPLEVGGFKTGNAKGAAFLFTTGTSRLPGTRHKATERRTVRERHPQTLKSSLLAWLQLSSLEGSQDRSTLVSAATAGTSV